MLGDSTESESTRGGSEWQRDSTMNDKQINPRVAGTAEDINLRVPPKQLSLAFSNIRFETNKGKVLLDDVTGFIDAGEFCGIMGPSGSGKTCLLDVLTMRKKKGGSLKEGKVLYGGKPLKARSKGESMCYIGQEDCLLPVFTVWETVAFAVRLEYGYSLSRHAMDRLVRNILEDIGLSSAADVTVGGAFSRKGISGGQRRRLMIAVELVSCPAVMILDEPTSGLDFASAFGVMKELKSLAKIGHTVVSVVHQPSSQIWGLFDKVGFIAHGSFVYFGKPDQVLTYFESLGQNCPEFYNPCEFVLELLAPTSELEQSDSDSYRDAFKNSAMLKDMVAKCAEEAAAGATRNSKVLDSTNTIDDFTAAPTNLGLCTSALVLLHRNMLDLLRNPALLIARLFLILLIVFLIGLTFFRVGDRYTDEAIRSRAGALFFLPSFTSLVTISLIPYFMESRTVIKKEIANGRYTVWAYALSYVVPLLLSSVIISILVSLVSFFMLGFRNFGEYFLAMLANFTLLEIMSVAAGAVVPHYLFGMLLVIGVAAGGMSTEGFFVIFNQLNYSVQWLGYITPQRYIFRAFMRNEFQDMGNLTSNNYPTGVDYLNFYGFNEEAFQSYWLDMAIVYAYVLATFGGFLVALRTWQK